MNPITNAKNLQKLNERELDLGLTGTSTSWHAEYKDSAWIFVGGLPYELTEGDVLCIFSQYGEIVNVNLVRDKDTGKSKGFGFICYEDQRSTILSVDNLNTSKILGRIIRVDHVKDYKPPKDFGTEDQVTQKLRSEGCAPQMESSNEEEDDYDIPTKKVKKDKKKKKKKEKKVKKEKRTKSESDNSDSESTDSKKNQRHAPVKTERLDPGYDKYVNVRDTKAERFTNSSRPSHSSFRGSGEQRDINSGHVSKNARDYPIKEEKQSFRNEVQSGYYEMEKHDRYKETKDNRDHRGKDSYQDRSRHEREDDHKRDKYRERDSGNTKIRDNRRGRSGSPPARDRHRDRARSRSRERYRR